MTVRVEQYVERGYNATFNFVVGTSEGYDVKPYLDVNVQAFGMGGFGSVGFPGSMLREMALGLTALADFYDIRKEEWEKRK